MRFCLFPKISLNKLPILRGAPLGPRSMIMNALVYVGKGQGIHRGKNKVTPNEKWKELDMWVFLSMKYSQLWSILVEHFNKYKPIISEGMVCVLTITSGNNLIFFILAFQVERNCHTRWWRDILRSSQRHIRSSWLARHPKTSASWNYTRG